MIDSQRLVGTFLELTAIDAESGEEAEIREYIARGRELYGNRLEGIDLTVDGEYVDIDYTIEPTKFERIRRITGYLVGTTDRFNDAKRDEEHDRVKHSLSGMMEQI